VLPNCDEEYSDWNEEEIQVTCLFCPSKMTDINDINNHMIERHNFNFKIITESLDFYQQVKLVNYIRRQIHNLHCSACDNVFLNNDALKAHMEEKSHCKLPSLDSFDQPE